MKRKLFLFLAVCMTIQVWSQSLMFEKDGGHGMIFKTFEGKLCLVLHSPNGGGLERAHLFEIEDCGDTLRLKGEVK